MSRWPLALLMLASAACAEPGDGRSVTAALKGPVAAALGTEGARIARGDGEWKALQDRLAAFGWKRGPKDALSTIDFSKEMVVCVFKSGDPGNTLVVRKSGGGAEEAELEVGLGFIIYKSHLEEPDVWTFLCVAVPRSPKLRLSVLSYHPMNDGPHKTLDQAAPEWSATLDGDHTGGLEATIRPEAAVVRPGDDIRIDFTLRFADRSQEGDRRFAPARDSVRVWDGKYSNGYRNHAFLVTLPDGTTKLLRPPEREFDKNIPHLVELGKGRTYNLPEWVDGEHFKSLKSLGLDTTAAGTYRITGVYTEAAGGGDEPTAQGQKCWGGEIFTETVTVEVK